jgi:hypothetical protein
MVHLAEQLPSQYEAGEIALPNSVREVLQNTDTMHEFFSSYVPEILTDQAARTEGLSAFAENNIPAFTAEQWQAWGVTSGDPLHIAETDQVKVGEIINVIINRTVKVV